MLGKEAGGGVGGSAAALRSVARPLGRAAIWVVLAILLLRGLLGVLSGGGEGGGEAQPAGSAPDLASLAFAKRFARAYLNEPSEEALSPMLAEGARLVSGRAPVRPSVPVTQTEVSARKRLGGGREVLTVACEYRGGRVLYLAVALVRSRSGAVAAAGPPWLVGAPSSRVALVRRPHPLTGPSAEAIGELIERFLPAYLSAGSASDLSYLVAPGARIAPPGGDFEPIGRLGAVRELGSGEGPRRRVAVAVRLKDRGSGAVYPLDYRLELVRRERWYVRAVEGSPR